MLFIQDFLNLCCDELYTYGETEALKLSDSPKVLTQVVELVPDSAWVLSPALPLVKHAFPLLIEITVLIQSLTYQFT